MNQWHFHIAINCMDGQILYRSQCMQQLMMKGKMAMKNGIKDSKMGVKDSGKGMAMETAKATMKLHWPMKIHHVC